MQQTLKKPTKQLELKYNKWIFIGLLYISIYFGTHFNTGMVINSFTNQLNMIFGAQYGTTSYGIYVFLRFGSALIGVIVFEIIARLFFTLTKMISLGSIQMKSDKFVDVLRLFEIVKYLVFVVLNILYYSFNFLIPIGTTLLTFLISTAVYFWFFLYLNKHYLDPKLAHRVFKMMAILYFGINFFQLIGGVL